MSFNIKQGDTNPPYTVLLNTGKTIEDGTVRFIMCAHPAAAQSTPKVDAEAVIVDPATNEVRYDWEPEDTDTPGDYDAEFRITYEDGTVQTIPGEGYLSVKISKKLPEEG